MLNRPQDELVYELRRVRREIQELVNRQSELTQKMIELIIELLRRVER